jgi:hypothetical protein
MVSLNSNLDNNSNTLLCISHQYSLKFGNSNITSYSLYRTHIIKEAILYRKVNMIIQKNIHKSNAVRKYNLMEIDFIPQLTSALSSDRYSSEQTHVQQEIIKYNIYPSFIKQ